MTANSRNFELGVPAATPSVNRLLARLPRRVRSAVLVRCETVELTSGELLCDPTNLLRHAFFPTEGFISLRASVQGHEAIEVGLVGNEGMFSPASVLGVDESPLGALVQGSGQALRMTATDLQRVARECAPLRETLQRYVCVVVAELAQAAVCKSFHLIDARLARWLLMSHDRMQGDHLRLTQEALATMLAVRRSGISVAAAELQDRKVISYSRGVITIVDRAGLEAASCECYAAATSSYRRYLG
jgi:CRP-like cAMP-binding protein